ncbi:MAG TPA: sigma 54-interacting transcriptional regulator [Bdellovibrionota bacterium]|nr:sigma 54-interacting transcriptional regulator [Bdellovibrionota bacterium]
MVVGLRSLKFFLFLSILCPLLCLSNPVESPPAEPEIQVETDALTTKDPIIRGFLDSFERGLDNKNTVLLIGETGSGKELVAHELHRRSPRAAAPFIVVDCGNITDTLAESELFGHEKGAFTGATQSRASVFEEAHGGTVFLDEIENMSRHLQAKLLRVLDIDPSRRRVSHTGALHELVPIDVRIIVATNVDLRELVDQGKFREDLYYRLNIRTLRIPPLRKRRADLEAMAEHFVRQFSNGKKTLSTALKQALPLYKWPGNVRELKNVLLKMCLFSENTKLLPEDLPRYVREILADNDVNIPHPEKPIVDIREELVRQDHSDAPHFQAIITQDPSMLAILHNIWKMKDTKYPVLITGETGTGKELIAQIIHRSSGKGNEKKKTLYAINCAAISPELAESELFGHVAGAFTGATRDRMGIFEAADGSTLFLDEVEALSPKLQRSLLRVLETGEIRPVGSNAHKKVKVRIVAASNEDLAKKVENGEFREDLYHRLNVISFDLPPLRQRQADIPLLAQHLGLQHGIQFTEEALQFLKQLYWAGNVRELEVMIVRLVDTAGTTRIDVKHVTSAIDEAELLRIRDLNDFKFKFSLLVERKIRETGRVEILSFWNEHFEKFVIQELRRFFDTTDHFVYATQITESYLTTNRGFLQESEFKFEKEFLQEVLLESVDPSSLRVFLERLKIELIGTIYARLLHEFQGETSHKLGLPLKWVRRSILLFVEPGLRERFFNDPSWMPLNLAEEYRDTDLESLTMSDWILRHYITWRKNKVSMTQVSEWCGIQVEELFSGLHYLGLTEELPPEIVGDVIATHFRKKGMERDAQNAYLELPPERADHRPRISVAIGRIGKNFDLDRAGRGREKLDEAGDIELVAARNGWVRNLGKGHRTARLGR